jgi:dTMP kinase
MVLERKDYAICAEAELLLFLSARAPACPGGHSAGHRPEDPVLCDRFSDATIAYQGFGRGLNIGALTQIDAFAAGVIKTDKTFLFDLLRRWSVRAMAGSPMDGGPKERPLRTRADCVS